MKAQVKGLEGEENTNDSGCRNSDEVTSDCVTEDGDGGHSNDANMKQSSGGSYGANASDGVRMTGHTTLQEVLYESLIREKEDESLQKQVKTLFASCNSVTAQENLLTSLRCVCVCVCVCVS